jgi:integrase
VVLVGIYTGARWPDCCRIEWEDIDLAEATPSLHQLKTGSRIQIPIYPALLEHLEAHASRTGDQAEAFLTPTLAEAETGGAHGLSLQIDEIMREAGQSRLPAKFLRRGWSLYSGGSGPPSISKSMTARSLVRSSPRLPARLISFLNCLVRLKVLTSPSRRRVLSCW